MMHINEINVKTFTRLKSLKQVLLLHTPISRLQKLIVLILNLFMINYLFKFLLVCVNIFKNEYYKEI